MRKHCCFRASGHTDIAIRFVGSDFLKESNRPNVDDNINVGCQFGEIKLCVNVTDLSTR